MLSAIRRYKRMAKIPLIILVVVLSFGLVGSYIFVQPLPKVNQETQTQDNTAVNTEEAIKNLQANINEYEKQYKANPKNSDTIIALGNSQYNLASYYFTLEKYQDGEKFFKDAVATYQKAIKMQPKNVNVMVDLATAALYSKQYAIAEKYYQKAIALDPKFLKARMNYGIYLKIVRNDVKGAKEQWQAALKTNPNAEVANVFKELINNAEQDNKK
ncbi:tetratricopeptide repeat protein [Bacillota bacterium LX-D]|nr:tetratricopeptide repeat protein [Bacillota bacterium LX-D]